MVYFDKHKTEILMFVSESLKEVFGGTPKIEYDRITLGSICLEISPYHEGTSFSINAWNTNDRRSKRVIESIVNQDPVITYIMNNKDTGVLYDTLTRKVDNLRIVNRMTTYRILSEVSGYLLKVVDTGIQVKYHTVLNGVEDLTERNQMLTFRAFGIADPSTEDIIIDELKGVLHNIHNVVDEIILLDLRDDNGSSIHIKMNDSESKITISYVYTKSEVDSLSLYGKKSVSMEVNNLHDDFTVLNIVQMITSIIQNGRKVS